MKTCNYCGKEATLQEIDNEYICESCIEKFFDYCDRCDEIFKKNDMKEICGETVCEECGDNCFTECDYCNDLYDSYDLERIDGKNICSNCKDDNFFYCEKCGEYYHNDEYNDIEDTIMCDRCTRENTIVCDWCGEIILEENSYSDNNICLCEHCRDYNAYVCNNCNNFVHTDDVYWDEYDYSYCPDCYRKNKVIKDYHYKPNPNFKGDGSTYLGVELEIDKGGKDDYNAREILDVANKYEEEHIYIKTDGSLNSGFEIVTHPATIDYHLKKFPWDRIINKAVKKGYKSHNTDTCGLHIHINRDTFGINEIEQDLNIAKLLYVFEKFWDNFVKFSRRNKSKLNEWANRYGYQDDAQELLKTAKDGRNRYTAVNLTPRNTIEIRIFKGTLKRSTLFAALQLCDHIVSYCKNNEIEIIQKATWQDIIKTEYTELNEYLEKFQLVS